MTDDHADTSGADTPDSHTPDTAPSVEEQRADVAETVAALAAKADVPTRVQHEAVVQADRAKSAAQDNPQFVAAAVGGVLTALVVTVLLRRRRRSRRFTR